MTARMTDIEDLGQYCTDMAAAPGLPKSEADLWRQIAGEVEQYLHPQNQSSLFEQPTQAEEEASK